MLKERFMLVNPSASELEKIAVLHEGAVRCSNGAIVINTGSFRTGRSPNDRFIVKDDVTSSSVDWGKVNKPFPAEKFTQLWKRINEYLDSSSCYESNMHVGASADYGYKIKVKTEKAWQHLFLKNMFINDGAQVKNNESWELVSAPGFKLDPEQDGVNSDAAVILNLSQKKIFIAGMQYAGEMKKAAFSCLNFVMPAFDVLPMHCAANMGVDGDVALFFGLSGTGKTTLSADSSRALIGDDEHGWSKEGVFNFEGGCYAKCINLKEENEKVIWDAIKKNAILENVVLDDNLVPDYSDDSIAENIRVSYPRSHVDNIVKANSGGHPNCIFLLSCDLYGVLPPISKLSHEQAAYYFLSGYTAKVGSTEVGSKNAISPTFSVCFGAPFFPSSPKVYADLLVKKLEETSAEVFLINTGWTNGSYHDGGSRFEIKTTRAVLQAALNGKINSYVPSQVPYFNFVVPAAIEGIDRSVLDPALGANNTDLEVNALNLSKKFIDNFAALGVCEELRKYGPTV